MGARGGGGMWWYHLISRVARLGVWSGVVVRTRKYVYIKWGGGKKINSSLTLSIPRSLQASPPPPGSPCTSGKESMVICTYIVVVVLLYDIIIV